MLITADGIRPYLGRTWFLLFLGLELARRKQRVLFLSSSERTDSMLRLDSLRGQETLLLDRDFTGSMPNLMEYIHEPFPGFHYLAAPRTRRVSVPDLKALCDSREHDVVICQYRLRQQEPLFCLVPGNLQALREKDAGRIWRRARRPLVSGMPPELLTPERRQMYGSLLGHDVRFVRWEPRLALIPCERELLDYFREETSGGYLADIRRLADDLVPQACVQETASRLQFWRKWVDRDHAQ